MLRLAVAGALTLALASCTWVELTEGGGEVRLAQADAAAGCERLGRISAATRDRVIGLKRRAAKVREELLALARNEAARLGGDTIVALDSPSEGRQRFSVWRCPDGS